MRKKRFHLHSQFRKIAGIFLALCLFALVSWAQKSKVSPEFALGIRLKEAEEALKTERERSASLERETAKLNKELEALRTRYADLYLKSRSGEQERQRMELGVAHLLAEHSDISSGKALARVVKALDQTRATQAKLAEEVRKFREYLVSVLQLLNSSDTLKREVSARYETLEKAVVRTRDPLSLTVAWRGSGRPSKRRCRVLSVDDDLQVVVLDVGERAGIRVGSLWVSGTDPRKQVGLRIVETRSEVSAAAIIRGDMKDVGPGSVVAPE